MLYDGRRRCKLEFPDCLPMENIAVVKFEFNFLTYNSSAPNPAHAM